MLWLSDVLWFGHECSGSRMLWEHECYYGLGMDAVDPQPAFIRRQAGVTYPRALRLGDRGKFGGLNAAGIPDTGHRGIEAYVSMREQVDFEAAQQVGSPFRRAGQVYVIEECPNAFARQGVGLEGTQGRGKAKGKQCRHERIPLFAPLGLENAVWYASIIDPHEFGRRSIKQSDEGEDAAGLGHMAEVVRSLATAICGGRSGGQSRAVPGAKSQCSAKSKQVVQTAEPDCLHQGDWMPKIHGRARPSQGRNRMLALWLGSAGSRMFR